jgi:hypothetical protein
MLNFFNNNILPLSEELQEMMDSRDLRDDKDRADALIDEIEAKAIKEEAMDCE